MTFRFNDSNSLADNVAAFARELDKIDATLGPALASRLNEIARDAEPTGILDQLFAAMAQIESED